MVQVGVLVGVPVIVGVRVTVGLLVGVFVGVLVPVGVLVQVGHGVAVMVGVFVRVGVGVMQAGCWYLTNRPGVIAALLQENCVYCGPAEPFCTPIVALLPSAICSGV